MKVYQKTLLNSFCFLAALAVMPQSAQATEDCGFYSVKNLVANESGVARFTDPNLLNPWGLVFNAEGNLIVANNHSNLATSYTPGGEVLDFQITVNSAPTGLVRNLSTEDFIIGSGSSARAASLLFASEDGTILGYNAQVNPDEALVVIDRSEFNAIYKGLALARNRTSERQFLYAADFYNARIDVFDHALNYVTSFTDTLIPEGFAPFNIRTICGRLYVTYAKQLPPENEDDQPGAGNGFVDIFTPDGILVKRLISRGKLNSPWGLAVAPKFFGKFSYALLVGNFGDGRINAYDFRTGKHLGQLADFFGTPLIIEGLWALDFTLVEKKPVLYFTAGPNDENDGVLGAIHAEKEDNPQKKDVEPPQKQGSEASGGTLWK